MITSPEPVDNIPGYPPVGSVLEALRKLPRCLVIPASQLAQEAGSQRASNMVLLGAVSALVPLTEETFQGAITELFAAKDAVVTEINLKAFAAGRAIARQSVCL